MKTTILKSLLIGALLQSAIPVQSQPAVYFGQPTLSGGFDGDDQMQGFEFIPGLDVTAIKLGLYDGRSSGGFQQPHQVAIWTGNGELITSAFIPQGELAVFQDNFRYVDIPPVQLTSGSTYIIAAFMPAPVIDYTVVWQRVALTNGIVSFDPRIEFVAYRAGASPGGISFPESRFTDIAGAFGPNFIIAVPEPSPIALFLAAAGMLILRVSQTQKVLSTRSLQ